MKHFEYRMIEPGNWRRFKGTVPAGQSNVARPHFVPKTKEGENFAGYETLINTTGLCPGEILVDGRWVTGYRFVRGTEEELSEALRALDERVESFMAAAQAQ